MSCHPFACPSWFSLVPLVFVHVEQHLQRSSLLMTQISYNLIESVIWYSRALPRPEIFGRSWLQPETVAVVAVDSWERWRPNYPMLAFTIVRSEVEYPRNSLRDRLSPVADRRITASLTWILAATESGRTRFAICNTSAKSSVALRDKFDPVVVSSSMAVSA